MNHHPDHPAARARAGTGAAAGVSGPARGNDDRGTSAGHGRDGRMQQQEEAGGAPPPQQQQQPPQRRRVTFAPGSAGAGLPAAVPIGQQRPPVPVNGNNGFRGGSRRSQARYDRLMMPSSPDERGGGHPGTGSSDGREPDIVVLCRAGRWDEVREWLLRRRRERDDDHPPSSPRRGDVSACPRGGGVETGHRPVAHFAPAVPGPLGPRRRRVRFSGEGEGESPPPPCRCQTALSIACRRERRFGQDPAPVDVIEALWRFCPGQLVHRTLNFAGYAGTPLHHALSAVRWGWGDEEGGDDGGVSGVCSGLDLDLVECLADADVALSTGGGGEGGRGNSPTYDGEEPKQAENSAAVPSAPAPTVAAVPPVASRLRDDHGRTPLQIWVSNIFPRLMTLGGQPEAGAADDAEGGAGAAAAAAAAIVADADAEAVFVRWTVVLRKLLLAWPGACSVPDANGATLLITVLRWEAPRGVLSRAAVERRLLGVVRIVLESSGGATCGSCSSFGCSPLHYAVAYKRSNAVIGAILEASSLTTTTTTPLPLRRNNVMEVPLHVAATLRAPLSVMGLLLRRRRGGGGGGGGGCSPAEQVAAVDRGGRSPLTWAYIRFLQHYHSAISSGKKGGGGDGSGREGPGGDAAASAYAHAPPAAVPRVGRRNVPRDLTAVEEEVLGSLRQCATDREELLSELGPFWDAAQLLLISAYHGRGRGRTVASPGGDVAGAETAAAAAEAATDTTLDDARSFLGAEASARLTEQVRGVLTPGDDMRGKRWRAVHAAASLCPGPCPRGVLAIAAMVHPGQLEERDERGRLPLHLSIDAWCGGDDDRRTGTSAAAAAPEWEEARTCCWTHDEAGPSSAVGTVLSAFPGAAGVPDGSSKRLPLHVAVEGVLRLLEPPSSSSSSSSSGGTSKSTTTTTGAGAGTVGERLRRDVRRIAMAHPGALGEGDVAAPPGPDLGGPGAAAEDETETTGGLLPFMLAAAGPRGSTCLAYELLREGPEVVSRGILVPPPAPAGGEGTEAEARGDGGGSGDGSAASPGVGGRAVPSSSSGSSSPSSSPGRSIEGRGRGHCGETARKRARCS